MIDLEEVRALAVARCFDVLEFEPEAVAAHVLAGRFDPIAVLDALERIEERAKRSVASITRTANSPSRQIASQTATVAKARMAQSPGRVD